MSAVEVTISGVLYNKVDRTTQPVVLIGEATLTGVGVGGGPIIPPPVEGKPPSIWPSPGRPTHPIVLPDPPPIDPPVEPPTRPDDPNWEWCWNPNTGWIPAFVAGDKPHPPGK